MPPSSLDYYKEINGRIFSLEGKKIWIAGETGLVGRALLRALRFRNVRLLSAPHSILDLTNQQKTYAWLEKARPDAVILAAAKVGGVLANKTRPADFIRDNLAIAHNVIEGAHRAGVERLLFLGSTCIYPKEAAMPVAESALLTGALEESNEAYAIAKIAGLKMCEFYRRQFGSSYISAMPCNLYGPYDRFDAYNGHVIPSLMMKFHAAKENGAEAVSLWGSGAASREFLHVDDLAAALLHLLEYYDGAPPVNIGSGEETTIAQLALVMKEVTRFYGDIVYDPSMPDGAPRRMIDSSRMRSLGWAPSIRLDKGIAATYQWYCGRHEKRAKRTG
ncbi:MAG: GDP-L-fucose synthase [Micavibrio sp.]